MRISRRVCVYVYVSVCKLCLGVFSLSGGVFEGWRAFPTHFIAAQFPVNQGVHQPGLALLFFPCLLKD